MRRFSFLLKAGLASKLGFYIGLIGFVIILSFIELNPTNPTVTKMFAIAFLMTIWWITEAVPFAVTSLLPIVFYPILGIMSGKDVSASYMNYIIFLFLGGFLLAKAIERWNLHKRIALKTILLFGQSPQKLILGFMISSAFFSMWISNTATCLMMLPIAMAITDKFEVEAPEVSKNLSKSLYISIAYACTLGGMSTPVGTPPNLIFFQTYTVLFPNHTEITFSDWFFASGPLSLIMLFIAWFVLTYIIFPVKKGYSINLNALKVQYQKLEKLSYEEWIVLISFILVSLAWIFRNDLNIGKVDIKGWGNWFTFKNFINDSTIVIGAIILLFIIPSKNVKHTFILDRESINEVPWHIILFFGGGFALALGMVNSGLSEYIATLFIEFKSIDYFTFLLVVGLIVSLLTEITSNLASAQMLLPILGSVAVSLNFDPIGVLYMTTIACSLAFMLPVATPPNTIVFGSGKIKILDMVKAGSILNIMGVLSLTLIVYYFLDF